MKLKQKGFTLLEMMIVVTILTMLMSGVFIAFRAGGDIWSSSEARMQRYQNARCILEQMQTEIGSLYFSNLNKCKGESNSFYFFTRLQPPSDLTIDDDGDGIPVPPAYDPNDTTQDICKIGYIVENDELKRYFDRGPADLSLPGDLSGLFADQVVSINFKYWDSKLTTNPPNWDTRGATSWPEDKTYKPKAVLITVVISDDITNYQQKFSTAVYIP